MCKIHEEKGIHDWEIDCCMECQNTEETRLDYKKYGWLKLAYNSPHEEIMKLLREGEITEEEWGEIRYRAEVHRIVAFNEGLVALKYST